MPLNFRQARNVQIRDSNIQDIVGNNNIQGGSSYNTNSGNKTTTTTTNSHNDSSTAIGHVADRYASAGYAEPNSAASFTASESQDTHLSSPADYPAASDGLHTQEKAGAPAGDSEALGPHAKHFHGSEPREAAVIVGREDDVGLKSTDASLPRLSSSAPTAASENRPCLPQQGTISFLGKMLLALRRRLWGPFAQPGAA
ncbi:hypothetical protein LshimejAT787_1700960 [Lyophyllum shimeji]|uniref:Uncharacterized protein n=1 Tax=Lyophyllum shimeji TaxID=47721 RepID=A0A9P3UQY0_LYOSH|nr:hypothetical protein LshimejAT787_1700960 [Lyophyllum shimeji]